MSISTACTVVGVERSFTADCRRVLPRPRFFPPSWATLRPRLREISRLPPVEHAPFATCYINGHVLSSLIAGYIEYRLQRLPPPGGRKFCVIPYGMQTYVPAWLLLAQTAICFLYLYFDCVLIGAIPWGHSGPLCHALSSSWTSMRRRRATVAAVGG